VHETHVEIQRQVRWGTIRLAPRSTYPTQGNTAALWAIMEREGLDAGLLPYDDSEKIELESCSGSWCQAISSLAGETDQRGPDVDAAGALFERHGLTKRRVAQKRMNFTSWRAVCMWALS
jgi:hypothetical protein